MIGGSADRVQIFTPSDMTCSGDTAQPKAQRIEDATPEVQCASKKIMNVIMALFALIYSCLPGSEPDFLDYGNKSRYPLIKKKINELEEALSAYEKLYKTHTQFQSTSENIFALIVKLSEDITDFNPQHSVFKPKLNEMIGRHVKHCYF